MWLITPIGFFSIVQKPGDKQNGTLTVRSRVRSDLVALRQHYLPGLGPIEESHHTDYRFRAIAPRAEISAAMARMVDTLDYSNFKSEVGKKQGQKRAGLYHEVWDVLYKLQTDPVFASKEPVADSYGGVIISGGGRILLREPTKHHGGYAWTFAKTEAKPGETPRDAAARAVREKTGYNAEIRASVPGLFRGSSSSTNYYIMDARHPPGKPGWQTANVRWVRFDEARDLIRQSPNAEGHERDLAILEAAEKAASAIPYKEHLKVQPEDWNDLHAMPERHIALYPKLWFNLEEMEKIQRGFYPTVMEQKWFLYFTGNRLRMHRSWTGMLIYDVGFAFNPEGGAYVSEMIVNRDPAQYGNTDNEEDLKLAEQIIRSHLLWPLEEPEVDGMVKAMSLATKPGYLGSPDVVSGLVKGIVDVVVRVLTNEAAEEDFVIAMYRLISAFTDDSAGYTKLPDWNNAEQMGVHVKHYLAPAERFDGTEDLMQILEVGVAAVIAKLHEMLAAFIHDPAANWEQHALPQLNGVHQFVVSVLLGTNTVMYGKKTLQDFQWAPVSVTAGNEQQVIVRVGSEGGDLTLYGLQSEKGWKFRLSCEESTLMELIDEAETGVADPEWLTTWRSALKKLNTYPWTQLHPVEVHPEFHQRVISALKTRAKKGINVDWESWASVLEICIETE